MANTTTDTTADPLVCGLAKFYKAEELVDFTILCGERRWNVHRLVLSAHSEVFAKACMSDFKEAEAREMKLEDDLAECVDAMLTYMYTSTYEYDKAYGESENAMGLMTFHVAMCIISDKYDVPGLKKDAIKQFCDKCNEADVVVLVNDFANAAMLAYQAAPATTEIREAIVKTIVAFDRDAYKVDTPDLDAAMKSNIDFAFDLATESRKQLRALKTDRYKCGNCKKEFLADVPKQLPDDISNCPHCGTGYRNSDWVGSFRV